MGRGREGWRHCRFLAAFLLRDPQPLSSHRLRSNKPLTIDHHTHPPPNPPTHLPTHPPAHPHTSPRSFNASQPIRDDVNPAGRGLFEREQEDLLHDLYDIPARSCDRRVNEFVKRVRWVAGWRGRVVERCGERVGRRRNGCVSGERHARCPCCWCCRHEWYP